MLVSSPSSAVLFPRTHTSVYSVSYHAPIPYDMSFLSAPCAASLQHVYFVCMWYIGLSMPLVSESSPSAQLHHLTMHAHMLPS